MSAYDEYAEEKRMIDELLAKGYAIAGVREGLDGAEVLFVKRGSAEAARAQVHLLTAEARKYMSYLVLVQQAEAQ